MILDLRDLPRFEAEGQSEAVNAFKRRPANVGNEAYDDVPENLKGRYKVYVIYNPCIGYHGTGTFTYELTIKSAIHVGINIPVPWILWDKDSFGGGC